MNYKNWSTALLKIFSYSSWLGLYKLAVRTAQQRHLNPILLNNPTNDLGLPTICKPLKMMCDLLSLTLVGRCFASHSNVALQNLNCDLGLSTFCKSSQTTQRHVELTHETSFGRAMIVWFSRHDCRAFCHQVVITMSCASKWRSRDYAIKKCSRNLTNFITLKISRTSMNFVNIWNSEHLSETLSWI